MTDIISSVYEVIQERKTRSAEQSYVAKLLAGGMDAIGSKITEEAGELLEAADGDDAAHTVHEAADLLFHMLVLLGHKDIDPQQVLDELKRRFGTSGIAEKAARVQKGAADA